MKNSFVHKLSNIINLLKKTLFAKMMRKEDLERECAEHNKYLNYQYALNRLNRNAERKVFDRFLRQELREKEIEEQLYKQEKLAALTDERIAREEKVAKEMYALKRTQILEEKMRQQLRESSQELKELEVKLRSAYVAKGLIAQKAEKEALLLQEKIKTKEEEALLRQAYEDYEEYQRKNFEQEKEKQHTLRQQLFQQMEDKINDKRKLYIEFLKDKKYIDEIIRRISEEQIEEMRQKLEKRKNYLSDINKILTAKDQFKKKQQEEIEEENKRIAIYLQEKEIKLREELEKMEEVKKARHGRGDKIAAVLTEQMEKARKHEELLIDLNIEERNEIEEQKERAALEEELRKRIELRFVLDLQKKDRQVQLQIDKEEDKKFHEQQMQFMADRDKIDQMSDEKKRRRQMEHRKAVQELLELRKQQHAQHVANLLYEKEMDEKAEQRKQQMIEEERIRMLKEHAAALIGFFPPGILRESDREYLALP